ncbi:hypothetical protein [Rhizobium phage RHph_I40]|uniref:Uncharacterized protein n=1 Tax=Rhizobium phage RHph_I38 TaxID=2509734 RepID=A0A7S5R8Q0_9CAUD|nr:hypothetical protein EVC01_002 [Rhizobium phage RHph_I38]QXV73631.1 hypothetical protein [Rhizobium phage RHph_I40]
MSTGKLTVYDFYKACAQWLRNPDDETIFTKSGGLCGNLYRYILYHHGVHMYNDSEFQKELSYADYCYYQTQQSIMYGHFEQHGLDTTFPFDSSGIYMQDMREGKSYLNEKRRAFVFAMSHDNQSAMLGMFYRWLVERLDRGEFPYNGICLTFDSFYVEQGLSLDCYYDVYVELKQQFDTVYGNSTYPFDDPLKYMDDKADNKLWCNPKRVEWVRAHAKLVQ